MATPIKEEDGVHKPWYDEANDMTTDKLPEFIRKLTRDYEHDYGTICHACAAAAVAAAASVNHSDQGGITSFQAGAIMWEFIKHWMHEEGPMRLVKYDEMLFPQYDTRFGTISKETWEYLQKKAAENIAEKNEFAHPDVIAHWQSIVDGTIPFGLALEN